MLIDTHCHLDAGKLDTDAVLARARAAGVGGFVCIGVGDLQRALQARALAHSHADVAATVGVHPHDAASFDASLERELCELLRDSKVVAVGEVGLDYHYDHSPRPIQVQVFRRFIGIAREFRKPIVVHTRSAKQETLQILREERASDVGGIIHCFSEDREFAARALELGFDLSFSGIVTFKNARSVREVAAWAPDDRVLVETDSPYLAPVPMRGRPCEPAFVIHTARCLAQLRETTLEHIEAITTANALRRFGVLLAAPAKVVQTSN